MFNLITFTTGRDIFVQNDSYNFKLFGYSGWKSISVKKKTQLNKMWCVKLKQGILFKRTQLNIVSFYVCQSRTCEPWMMDNGSPFRINICISVWWRSSSNLYFSELALKSNTMRLYDLYCALNVTSLLVG